MQKYTRAWQGQQWHRDNPDGPRCGIIPIYRAEVADPVRDWPIAGQLCRACNEPKHLQEAQDISHRQFKQLLDFQTVLWS